MGRTPEDKIDRWVAAAGQSNKGQAVRNRVITAGEFLEKTGRLSEREASGCLTGIDFSKPVQVIRLPDKLYVQYVIKHKGIWFTDTGLTPDLVGLAKGNRQRKLFRPIGVVFALQSTARSIRDTWTIPAPADATKEQKRKLAVLTRGGGTQYIVPEKHRMKLVT